VVRRIPIRAKVAGALSLPLIGLAAAAGIGASANAAASRNVARQAELATASIGHAGLIGALQNERNLALVDMLGLTDDIELEVADTATARELTDQASTELHHSVDDQSGALRDDYIEALQSLTALTGMRDQVDAATPGAGMTNRVAAHEIFLAYTSMVATLFASHDRFALEVDDGGLRQGDDLVHSSSHATDATAQLVERLQYHASGPGGLDQPAEITEVAELRRDLERYNRAIEVKGTGEYAAATGELLANPRVMGLPELATAALTQGAPVDPATLLATTPLGPDGGYQPFRDDVVDLLDARAADLRADADARRRLILGAGLATVLIAVVIAWWVSRSITRPLRDLSLTARSIATYRLPAAVEEILAAPPGEDLVLPEVQPITVRASDEVADVAGAFNLVQDSAIALATEQAALRRNIAESYVNLGRRNQNLLSRLLDVVGDLEGDEHDTERLTKLYRLDHLATRIRRNAESLLVLSQATPPATWKPPVALADVVRAALGEIENYERVLVRTLDPTMVMGNASSDLAHLLAELIENGLRHSPPRELVEVSGRISGDGYVITIVDHGLGMTPDEIDRANQRLAGTESFTVTPAKYLGHYVTAVLAARHEITVRLQGSVVVGIAARVDLPARLLVENADLLALPSAGNGTGRPAAAVPPPRGALPPAPPPVPPPPAPVSGSPSPWPAHAWTGPGSGPADLRSGPARRMPDWAQQVAELPGFAGPRARGTASAAPGALGAATDGAAPYPPPPPPPPPTAAPERTASGLVRRVRGAHAPTGSSAAPREPSGTAIPGTAMPDTATPTATPGTATPGAASSQPVNGAEIQRFLTSLVGGVQRSLEQQSSANGAGTPSRERADASERGDDAH
jgi:signal transduction histidine kinase